MLIHTIFDVLAWMAGGALGWWLRGRDRPSAGRRFTLNGDPGYFIALAAGALSAAYLFGTLNLEFAGRAVLGHSIAGAIFGGVIGVELYKLAHGIRGSTGVGFVAPLALGIAVGRWGCFFAGLPDYTYGTPTTLPWGVDFGDGVPRHPVQLYESFAMLAFLAVFLWQRAIGSAFMARHGFYVFVGWYALQRFAWEFLKPYPRILGPFDLFHLLCIVLLAYSAIMLRRNHDLRPAV